MEILVSSCLLCCFPPTWQWRHVGLKSPIIRLFVQQLVKTNNRETQKLYITGSFVRKASVTIGFTSQKSSSAECVSTAGCHDKIGLSIISHLGVIWRVFGSRGSMTNRNPGNSRISGLVIGYTTRSKWGPFGELFFAGQNDFSWRKIVLLWVKFPQEELVSWSVYDDNMPLCKNQQMNGKIQ